MQRTANVVWAGDLRNGSGTINTGSKTITNLPVTFPARLESESDVTSPEELIAAAHAACYNMALSNILAQGGNAPTRLETSAEATFEKVEAGWRLTTMALSVRGDVPGIDADGFAAAAAKAKDGCPVSNALAGNVEITLESALT